MMALDRRPELCNVNPNAKHIKTIILTKNQMKPPVLTRFSFIWPSDLFCLPNMTTFEHGLDIKTNILTKFQLAQSKNVASAVLTLFSFKIVT